MDKPNNFLACPFCGASGGLSVVERRKGNTFVTCSHCCAQGPPSGDGKKGAVIKWNTRAGAVRASQKNGGKQLGAVSWLDACKRRYEAAITEHSKAQTADEENRLFDEVVAATDEYRAAKASNVKLSHEEGGKEQR